MKKNIIESSIIISVYNEDRFIENCLNSLINEIINKPTIELIIIDNSSKDHTNYLCKQFIEEYRNSINVKFIVIKHDKLTISRNTGIKFSEGKYLHFIDGDTIVEKGFHENIIKLFKKTNCDIIGGNIKLLNNTSIIANFIWNSFMSQYFTIGKPLIGANMAFKKEVFDKIGLFDLCENSRGDETLLLKKYETKIKNKKQLFCKESNLQHFCIDNLKKWFLVKFEEGVAGANIQRKHKETFLKKLLMIYRLTHILLPLHLTLYLIYTKWNKELFLFHLLIVLTKPLIQINFFINGIKNCFRNKDLIEIFFIIPFILTTRIFLDAGYIYGLLKYKKKTLEVNQFINGEVLENMSIKNEN